MSSMPSTALAVAATAIVGCMAAPAQPVHQFQAAGLVGDIADALHWLYAQGALIFSTADRGYSAADLSYMLSPGEDGQGRFLAYRHALIAVVMGMAAALYLSQGFLIQVYRTYKDDMATGVQRLPNVFSASERAAADDIEPDTPASAGATPKSGKSARSARSAKSVGSAKSNGSTPGTGKSGKPVTKRAAPKAASKRVAASPKGTPRSAKPKAA